MYTVVYGVYPIHFGPFEPCICLSTHFQLFPLYFALFNNCISSPKRCIPMYTGCILCTYALPISVFYLRSASLYVNLQLTFSTHIYSIASMYISVYRSYINLFFNFRKSTVPFQQHIFTAIKPDFEFDPLYVFQLVYQRIKYVYNMYTAA